MAGNGVDHTREKIPHPSTSALDLATIMRTVGDPVRLDVVRLLGDGREWSCTQLADTVGIPASTSSYHLRLLREAGVTRTRPTACIASSACGATTSRSASPGSSAS